MLFRSRALSDSFPPPNEVHYYSMNSSLMMLFRFHVGGGRNDGFVVVLPLGVRTLNKVVQAGWPGRETKVIITMGIRITRAKTTCQMSGLVFVTMATIAPVMATLRMEWRGIGRGMMIREGAVLVDIGDAKLAEQGLDEEAKPG